MFFYKRVFFKFVFSQGDRKLGIPGEGLKGVFAAREFVNWYNGHPSFADLNPDLSCDAAVVIGQGNVALDCGRLLLKDTDELAATDISIDALAALKKRYHISCDMCVYLCAVMCACALV